MTDMQQRNFVAGRAVGAPPHEAVWIAEWRDTGSREALTQLVRDNAGRISAMARVWSKGTALQEDLVSEGIIALMKCLESYVPRDGVPFFAYARPFIRAAMRRTFYQSRSVVSVPVHEIRAVQEGRATAEDAALLHAAVRPDTAEVEDVGVEDRSGESLLIQTEVEGNRNSVLQAAAAALAQTDRLFVERRRAEDCSLQELALRVGVSPAHALKVEARALARLKVQLIRLGVTSADGLGA